MGQINCQCQITNIIEEAENPIRNRKQMEYKPNTLKQARLTTIAIPPRFINTHQPKNAKSSAQYFSSFPFEHKTIITLKGEMVSFDIKLKQGEQTDVGTEIGCKQCVNFLNLSNSFRFSANYRNRSAHFKDKGEGLGCWLRKKKLIQIADSTEVMLNVNQTFLILKFRENGKIQYKISQCDLETTGILQNFNLQAKTDEIFLSNDQFLLVEKREEKSYCVKLKDKSSFWIYLSQQKRIKEGDKIKLGSQLFQISSIRMFKDRVAEQ